MKIWKFKTINELFDRKYGHLGSKTRIEFEEKARAYMEKCTSHPQDNELIPLDAVVKIISGIYKGKKARIKDYTFQLNGKGFLNYLGYIQGK